MPDRILRSAWTLGKSYKFLLQAHRRFSTETLCRSDDSEIVNGRVMCCAICGDRQCIWTHNARAVLTRSMNVVVIDFLFGARGLLTSSAHPSQRTRRVASKLLPSNYARIFLNQCIFTGAKSTTKLGYTFHICMNSIIGVIESTSIHVRGLLLRARDFNN